MCHRIIPFLKRKLEPHPLLYRIMNRCYVRRHVPLALMLRPRQVRKYFAGHPCRKVQIGAGTHKADGWLMADYNPIDRTVIYLDARRQFPFPDDSIDYYYSEHLLAELTYPDGRRMLQEIFRTLRDGGRLRIATPDLQKIMSLYGSHRPGSIESRYVEWSQSTMNLNVPQTRAAFAINNLFSHRGTFVGFYYDAATLTDLLVASGFSDIRQCPVGSSDDPALLNLEQHGEIIGADFNLFETMVLEATKIRSASGEALRPADTSGR